MTLGEKIKEARKKRGWTLEQLGSTVGLGISTLSGYENDQTKGGPDADTLCKIADALNDISILTHHCQTCPVRNMAFIKQFPDLNNIRRDPAVIAARLRKEMIEAADALDRLTERFSDADFKSRPDYMDTFTREMEQVIDAKRCIEILEFELVLSGTHSSHDLKRVYERQQAKCIEHGHHKPDQAQDKAA
jgi:transcriptional regulator with XRE-family HTH domain